MARYRHYRNPKEPGVPPFVTTTVLDFVHAFRREEMRDAIGYHLARECKLAGLPLYGFVVMPHPIHMIVRLAPKLAVLDFRWSSARFLMAGLWSEEAGLPYNEVMESLGTWREDRVRSAKERAEA